MDERGREPAEAETRRRQAEPEPLAHEVLALQRRLGNQAVLRLLSAGGTLARKEPPAPTRTPIAPVTDLFGKANAEQWDTQLKEGVKEPYSEIATLLNATVIEDVVGTRPEHINGALRAVADELKPGLNFVGRLQPPGQCGYLYDGKFSAQLPTGRDGPLPTVAILLGPNAFVAGNKARTLAVLRHELEHAAHNRMAITWLKRWRADEKAKAADVPFRTWLGKQSIAAADLALVRERIDNTDINTEALAHLEGYMAGFSHESPAAAKSSRAAYGELHQAADHWLDSDPAIKQEFSTRLREFKARLKGERLTAFAADMQRLKAENGKLAALVNPLA